MNNQKEQELYEQFKDLSQPGINNIFFGLCYHGMLKEIKFILTYPKLKKHADIHGEDDLGFLHACEKGHLDVVKYLLSSPDLKEHANIHAEHDLGFKLACENEHLEITKCLIFDCNIKKSKYINNYLNRKPNPQVENMFKIRELNKKLEKNLSFNKINNKKIKV